VRNHEAYAAKSEQLLSQYKQEADLLRPENDQLKKDMTWLATQAKNSKLANDKAIQDLQAYTQILRGMEKRL
jgi:hypothetical protein